MDGKNNDLSLCWELNFIIMQILRKEIVLYCQPTWPPCHVGANQEYAWLAQRETSVVVLVCLLKSQTFWMGLIKTHFLFQADLLKTHCALFLGECRLCSVCQL